MQVIDLFGTSLLSLGDLFPTCLEPTVGESP